MNNTFFIADPHFSHKNIIKYENRPFQSTDEMDKELIKNWNKTVKKSDKVFVLGDFALTNKIGIKSIVEQLNGHKVLVMGNHDGYNPSFYLEAGFAEVSKYPIILNNFWILSHEPMYVSDNMPYVNIFGHVHSNPAFVDYSKQTICVSVERKHMGYTPISFKRIKELLEVK